MTTHFAKLMGNIKEIEIDFNKISQSLSSHFDIYKNTIKALDEDVTSTSIIIDKDKISDQNNTKIKECYKRIIQISKKELELPLASNKKHLEQLERVLSKIIDKLNTYKDNLKQESKKNKIKITDEEIIILGDVTAELLLAIQNKKQELDDLFELLLPIQEKINNIKKYIEQHEYLKKETRIVTQLTALVNKIPSENRAIFSNADLLKQLDILKGIYHNEDFNMSSLQLEEFSSTSKMNLDFTTENFDCNSSTTLLNQFNLKAIDQVNTGSAIPAKVDELTEQTALELSETTNVGDHKAIVNNLKI